ncbi:MAG: hypothetical protein HC888_19285 [Candidatus Competibacteraceae bacterium]|nr:hypothetical protein [Candidatus Competibacteraceae bacterium]
MNSLIPFGVQPDAGRVVAMRRQGKSSFGELRDESGQIQVFFNAKSLGDEAYAAIKDLDLGDFIGVEGVVKRTRTNEITIFADRYELLTKSLRPAVQKWHGLEDVDDPLPPALPRHGRQSRSAGAVPQAHRRH